MSAALQNRARVRGSASGALSPQRLSTRVRAAPPLPDPSSLPSLDEINRTASNLSDTGAADRVSEALDSASALPPEVLYIGLGAAGAPLSLAHGREMLVSPFASRLIAS